MKIIINLYNLIILLISMILWFVLSLITWFELLIITPIYFLYKGELYFMKYLPFCLTCATWFYYKFKVNNENNGD